MGEVATPLMITSADMATGGVHVFKSRYLADLGEPYERDGNVLLRDAILASLCPPLRTLTRGPSDHISWSMEVYGPTPVNHRPN